MRWLRSSFVLLLPSLLAAQVRLDPERYPQFVALFDQPASHSLGCDVRPSPPHLNYGFALVSGYYGHLPLKHYIGPGHRFAILIRVAPEDPGSPPAYFSQFFRPPSLPGKTSAELDMDGAFITGEGRYRVDWLLVDRDGQACRHSWRIDAKLPHGDRGLRLSLPPGAVAPLNPESWVAPESRLAEAGPLRLAIYLHVAPLSTRRLKMHSFDQSMLLSSVLSLVQRSPFARIKLIAFNLDQQREIFRQDDLDAEGWDRLVAAVSNLNLTTVDIDVLKRQRGHVSMLERYISDEIGAPSPSDAVLFLGPSARQSEKFHLPEAANTAGPRFFYFQYRPQWARGAEFPDILSHAVRALSGKVRSIYSPHDFSTALRDLNQSVSERPKTGLN